MKKDNLKRDINFFEAIFKDKTKKTRDMEKDIKTSIKVFAGVACVAVVLIGGSIGFTMIRTSALISENSSLASPEKLDEIAQNKAKAESLKVQNQKLDEKIKEFNEITKLTLDDLTDVASDQPFGITITGVSYKDGELKLTCQGDNELIGAYFAQTLRKSEKFDDVTYTGVNKAENNIYIAEVTVKLHSEVEDEKGANK